MLHTFKIMLMYVQESILCYKKRLHKEVETLQPCSTVYAPEKEKGYHYFVFNIINKKTYQFLNLILTLVEVNTYLYLF